MLMSAMAILSTIGVAVRSPRPSNSSSISEWRLFDPASQPCAKSEKSPGASNSGAL
jgi:hypothetical protein